MKKNIIISILMLAVVAFVAGCANKDAKAQVLLTEAISYADGTPSSQSAKDAALKLAAAKGFLPGNDASSLTEREIVMIAGRLLCDEIQTQYPTTPSAIKAAEIKLQINRSLNAIASQRMQSMYPSFY